MAGIKKRTISIFGSCISRDPFSFYPNDRFEIQAYIARNSFAGISCPPLEFDPYWYSELPKFEQRCIRHDFQKDYVSTLVTEPSDFLLIDMIDERFDLIEVDGTLLSKTKHILLPGFAAKYGNGARPVPRLSDNTFAMWAEGCRTFLNQMALAYKPDQIILVAGRWADAFKDTSGNISPFKPPYSDLIPAHNDLLDQMFSVFTSNSPKSPVFRPSPQSVFADPEHRWSKEPFHYVPSFYQEFMDWMDARA